MKPKSIEEAQKQRKREAVYGIVGFFLLQLACAVAFGSLCLIPDMPWGLRVFFLALAAICLLLILPALGVLKTRFQEIEGGELDAAGQY